MSNFVLSKGATPMNQHFEITMLKSKFCADYAMQNHFKLRSTQPDTVQPGTNLLHIWLWKNDARQNQRKLLMQTSIFQSTLHAKPYTLEKSCTFKDKCAVNAEIFICNLLIGPLINMTFKGQRTTLKERAFQQCIAT